MNHIRAILKNAYQRAESNDDTHFALSATQRKWAETIVEKAESQKAVLAVLITSLVKKIETPTQDVRYHKKELPNGYSGRGFDTQYVTPFIAEKFRRLAMKAGSGWLTRSIEQAHPFTLEFPGRIRNQSMKEAFLQILNDIEENQADPQKYLHSVFASLIDFMERSKINPILLERVNGQTLQADAVTIEDIVNLLKSHFSPNYRVAGASRLPVLAVYSAYEMLFMGNDRYRDKILLPLKSHTTSDIKSRGIGDIEVLDETGNFFEAVEIKYNIPISSTLVQDAYDKFAQTSVRRYYLLTTAEPDVDNVNAVNQQVRKIHTEHGCEVIVNGILPSLKYYLRLLSNPRLFLDCYSRNLQLDFKENTDVKEVHLRHWNELLDTLLQKIRLK
jgi:DNA (cytosine-5)-methyltransferase 1